MLTAAHVVNNKAFIFLIVAVSAILLIFFLPRETVSPFIILIAGSVLCMMVIFMFTPPEEIRYISNLFMVGALLRILLSVILYLLSWPMHIHGRSVLIGFFIGDGAGYSSNGLKIAQSWASGLPLARDKLIEQSMSGIVGNYDFWNAIVYYFTGESPLCMFFINSFAGALTIVFVYLISREIFNREVAKMAAGFSAFWPSLVLWSTQNLKEPLSNLFTCMAIWAFFELFKKKNPFYAALLFVAILPLFKIRPHIILLFMASAGVSFFIFNFCKPERLVLGLTALLFLILAGIACWDYLMSKWFIVMTKILATHNYASLAEVMNVARIEKAEGAKTAFLVGFAHKSPISLFIFIPIGLLISFLAPFPWQIGSISQIMALPETLVFYALLPCTVAGLIFSVKRRWNKTFFIVWFIITGLAFLSISEGNIGTLFRHKSTLLHFILIFTSAGIILKRKARS